MKTLKPFMIMAILIIGGLAPTGCGGSKASYNQQTTPDKQSGSQAEREPSDTTERKQVLDSINVVVSQIETLSRGQKTNTDSIEKVSKDVSDLKKSSLLFDSISWVIAAFALLIAVISLIKLNSVQKRADRHRKDIGDLNRRINSLEQNLTVASTWYNTTNSECKELYSRIREIERQLYKMNQGSFYEYQNKLTTNPASEVKRFDNEQSGYFELPAQMSSTEAYFKRLSDNREPYSRFTVEVSNDEAKFRPLEGTQYLNDLKSSDAIKMALVITGCDLSEANQMRVKFPGVAKKEGDRWIITEKATIELSK